jgi:hypothetical protein
MRIHFRNSHHEASPSSTTDSQSYSFHAHRRAYTARAYLRCCGASSTVNGMTGAVETVEGALSGARGKVGDRFEEDPVVETESIVAGVSCSFWSRRVVAGVAGYPDDNRGVPFIALRCDGEPGCVIASEGTNVKKVELCCSIETVTPRVKSRPLSKRNPSAVCSLAKQSLQ